MIHKQKLISGIKEEIKLLPAQFYLQAQPQKQLQLQVFSVRQELEGAP